MMRLRKLGADRPDEVERQASLWLEPPRRGRRLPSAIVGAQGTRGKTSWRLTLPSATSRWAMVTALP